MSTTTSQEPLVAVVMPALNEAGKIGRVLDKMPTDGRFEAIVVDDGSTDARSWSRNCWCICRRNVRPAN
jgi:hypothetical protein